MELSLKGSGLGQYHRGYFFKWKRGGRSIQKNQKNFWMDDSSNLPEAILYYSAKWTKGDIQQARRVPLFHRYNQLADDWSTTWLPCSNFSQSTDGRSICSGSVDDKSLKKKRKKDGILQGNWIHMSVLYHIYTVCHTVSEFIIHKNT